MFDQRHVKLSACVADDGWLEARRQHEDGRMSRVVMVEVVDVQKSQLRSVTTTTALVESGSLVFASEVAAIITTRCNFQS